MLDWLFNIKEDNSMKIDDLKEEIILLEKKIELLEQCIELQEKLNSYQHPVLPMYIPK